MGFLMVMRVTCRSEQILRQLLPLLEVRFYGHVRHNFYLDNAHASR